MSSEREIDQEYLSALERKLKALQDPNGKRGTSKALLSDLASHKDHQLFRLITGKDELVQAFDDNFADIPIQPNYLQRKIAPQTCAINRQEKLQLLKNDIAQKLHAETEGISEEELKLEEKELEKEIRELRIAVEAEKKSGVEEED